MGQRSDTADKGHCCWSGGPKDHGGFGVGIDYMVEMPVQEEGQNRVSAVWDWGGWHKK